MGNIKEEDEDQPEWYTLPHSKGSHSVHLAGGGGNVGIVSKRDDGKYGFFHPESMTISHPHHEGFRSHHSAAAALAQHHAALERGEDTFPHPIHYLDAGELHGLARKRVAREKSIQSVKSGKTKVQTIPIK